METGKPIMVNEGRSWLTLDCRRGDCREDDRRFLRGELRESTCFEWNCLALTLPVGGWTERRVRNLDTCTVQCPPPTNAKARASVGQIRSKGNVENPGTVTARQRFHHPALNASLDFVKFRPGGGGLSFHHTSCGVAFQRCTRKPI